MRKLYFFITLLFSISASAQYFDVKTFRALPQDMDARINYPVLDQNGEKAALLKIVTTKTGFHFEAGMLGVVKTEQKAGEIWVYVPHGSRKLTIKHAELGVLRDYNYPIAIQEAGVYEMQLVTGKVTQIVQSYKIDAQWLVIQSEPSGATVYINGNEVGQTPLNRKFKTGKYDFRIEYPRYHAEIGKLEIKDEKLVLDYSLKPQFGEVYVESFPESGMEIFLDNKSTGKFTPAKIKSIDSGKHSLSLRSKWYQNMSQVVLVEDEKTSNLRFDMHPAFAEIHIQTLEGAEIRIDDVKKGESEWSGRLLEGVYDIHVSKASYLSVRRQVEVKSGENIQLDMELYAKTGNLDVISQPVGAEIYLDGKLKGHTPETLTGLLCGEHKLVIKSKGFADHVQAVTIRESETVLVDTVLKTGESIHFQSDPSGVEFYVNGKLAGNTPIIANLSYGEYDIRLARGQLKKKLKLDVEPAMQNEIRIDMRNRSEKEEDQMWDRVRKTNSDAGYKAYLEKYPKGRHVAEARDLLLSLKAEEEEMLYQKAINSKLLVDYEAYADNYPKGKYIHEIAESLKDSYYQFGSEAFEAKSYSQAYAYFTEYLTHFPSAEHRVEVEAKQKKASRRMGRTDQVFLMYNYDAESEYGLSIGSLKKRGMGSYYALKFDHNILSPGASVLYTESEYLDTPFHSDEVTSHKVGSIAGSAGVTYALFYPVWVYGGVGYGYYPYYKQYDEGMVDFWVKSESLTKHRFFYECGFMMNLGNAISLKAGMLVHDQAIFQFGLGGRF